MFKPHPNQRARKAFQEPSEELILGKGKSPDPRILAWLMKNRKVKVKG